MVKSEDDQTDKTAYFESCFIEPPNMSDYGNDEAKFTSEITLWDEIYDFEFLK